MDEHLLKDIRVLDFGRYIAGPYCAALLAEYGADVIRIEKRGGSEDRFLGPVSESGEGASFMQINRNKRSFTLNPMSEQGRIIVQKLVATADIVVANLPQPTLEAMGLDYLSLSAINSRIILVTSTAFGAIGPMASNVGFDGVAQAMSGSAFMSGMPGEPSRTAVPWVDFGTATHCAFGALAALMAREKTGKGQVVTGSLLATALSFSNSLLIEQAVNAPNRIPSGNRGQLAAPSDILKARDGSILIQVVGQPLYVRWAKLMGEPLWLSDSRFSDDLKRGEHAQLICERATQWCAERTVEQAISELAAANIPCAPVLSPQQALDHPQMQSLGIFNPIDFPGMAKPAPVVRAAVNLSEVEKTPILRAPLLGEHTNSILIELGFSEEQIEQLRVDGDV